MNLNKILLPKFSFRPLDFRSNPISEKHSFSKMKICFICTEIFAWGKYGGFGRATRLIASQMVKRGLDIYAVVPAREGQNNFEILDGIKVYSYPMHNPFKSIKIFKEINADIYHSQEPSFVSYLALKSVKNKKHIITFRDTRLFKDWFIEFSNPSLSKAQVISNFIFENNFFVSSAVRKAQGKYAAAEFLSAVSKNKYRLKKLPKVLRSPVEINNSTHKATKPTVFYLGRLDKRKRPEKFLELAKSFPEVDFFVLGKARDKRYDNFLKKKYSHFVNIKFLGFIDQFSTSCFSEILSKSWILINTSFREGLPNSFIEAMANKCAILSTVNPDNVAERFGYQVKNDNYEAGLRYLLLKNNWKEKGEQGFNFVLEHYNMDKAIDDHLNAYYEILNESIQIRNERQEFGDAISV